MTSFRTKNGKKTSETEHLQQLKPELHQGLLICQPPYLIDIAVDVGSL